MTPEEKSQWWTRTVTALENRDPRLHLALLTALILRHGGMEECETGHTHIFERISLEEILHTVNDYHFACRVPEHGIIEIQAIAKGDVDGTPPNPGQPGPSPRHL